MKRWAWLALGLAMAAGVAQAADFRALRHLNAPPPSQVTPLTSGVKAQPVDLVRVLVQPKNGEAWAIAYTSIMVRAEGDTSPAYKMMTWTSGKVQEQTAAYKSVFEDELKKAGFSPDSGDSIFGDVAGGSRSNLKLGVLIDDIQGRFCVDCPNLFNHDGIPATVMMHANWEIYSTLDRKVVFKTTTQGGADYKPKLSESFLPAVYEGFRENVRQLLMNPDFRKLVTSAPGSIAAAAAPSAISTQPGLTLVAAGAAPTVPQASASVATVFANDGSGSGFLVSDDGYMLTNHHVVGAAKYVKLKWSDGKESLGEVIRSDPRRDVALIKADAGGRAPLRLRLSKAQISETVFAVGSPFGEQYQSTLSKGIVSALRTIDGLDLIQSDVSVNHGNSGGPLLDESGRVIGMTDWGHVENGVPVGVNLFIPISDALATLNLVPPPEPPVQRTAAAPPPASKARVKP
ncbi:MAG: trypsin-like peptidase domain-containing protein [Proteobacteria bacterium]|nr:trypsin-like peptidase domain-containing protein [Pseudomonadota bacterium]